MDCAGDHHPGDRSPSLQSLFIPALAVLAIATAAAAKSRDVAEAVAILGDVRTWPLLVAIGASCIGVVNRASQLQSAHRLAGIEVSVWSLLRVSAAAYALNKLVKTGGLGGVAMIVRHGAARGSATGATLTACMLNSISGHLAMALTVFVGLALVGLDGSAPGPQASPWVIMMVPLATIAGTGGVVVVADRGQATARYWLQRADALMLGSRARSVLETLTASIDSLLGALATLRSTRPGSLRVFVHAVAAKLLGAAILVSSLGAVGAEIPIGAALAVYALALITAAISVLPAGLGAVEATTTVLLTGAGVPMATALAGTLLFRLLDLWLPVLVGAIAAATTEGHAAGKHAAAPAEGLTGAAGI